MQRFTIVVAILSVCVIAVLTEFLVHDYSFSPSDHGSADVFMADPDEYAIEKLLLAGMDTSEFDVSLLSEDDLRDAGLFEYALQKADFDGYLFGSIDLTEFYDLQVKKLRLIDNALNIPTIVGAIYQLDLGEEALSNEMYRIIRERAQAQSGFSLNETNKYGDASLFINHDLRIGTAFLLVKLDKKVYAFTYPKVRHENIKKLIEKLHGKESGKSS